jgi:hypothetical protein
MRRTIQRAIGDPLSEEMIKGRFKESRKIRVVLRDGAPTFIEQEAMAEAQRTAVQARHTLFDKSPCDPRFSSGKGRIVSSGIG